MATITKRGETFRIKVSLGYDANGKQIVKSTTFTPPIGATPKKAEKPANEYAFEFERHCKGYAQLNVICASRNLRERSAIALHTPKWCSLQQTETTATGRRGERPLSAF